MSRALLVAACLALAAPAAEAAATEGNDELLNHLATIPYLGGN